MRRRPVDEPKFDNGIMNVKRNLTVLLGFFTVLMLLSGCGYMRSKFGSKSEVYKVSSQGEPLKVPSDLDSPNNSGTLIIPERNPTTAPAEIGTGAPSTIMANQTAPPRAVAPSLGGEGINIADAPASTWKRVGLALERSGVAKIESRDEKTLTYEVLSSGGTTQSPGWVKEAFTLGMADDKKVQTLVRLRLRVTGSGNQSKVTVEGTTSEAASDAARSILEVLAQRMS